MNTNLTKNELKNKPDSMTSPVQSDHPWRQSGNATIILWWEGFVEKVVLSLDWKAEGVVMDAESGEDDEVGLTSEWGGESRQDWQDWRNKSASQEHGWNLLWPIDSR